MWNKSVKRIDLERRIEKNFTSAVRWAYFWMVMGLPLLLLGFSRWYGFMAKMIRKYREKWLMALQELKDLEEREGFPAMNAYKKQVSDLCIKLPPEVIRAYYPLSGIDIYWATSFPMLILEDKNFDETKENPSMWWGAEFYSIARRREAEQLLMRAAIIPQNAAISYIKQDSDKSQLLYILNKPDTALICKSGHPISRLFCNRLKGTDIRFGAIIIVNDSWPKQKLDSLLASYDYICVCSIKGEKFTTPYAMPIGEAHLYLGRGDVEEESI